MTIRQARMERSLGVHTDSFASLAGSRFCVYRSTINSKHGSGEKSTACNGTYLSCSKWLQSAQVGSAFQIEACLARPL